MKKWRRRRSLLWLAVALLLLPAYVVVPALLRHEHFYHGFPSAYWASAVNQWAGTQDGTEAGRPTPLDRLKVLLHLDSEPTVLSGDFDAAPVLLELLASREKRVAPRLSVPSTRL
jgi:hypothetical protein